MKLISFILLLLYSQFGFAQSESKFTLYPSLVSNFVKFNGYSKFRKFLDLEEVIENENVLFQLEGQINNSFSVNTSFGFENNFLKNENELISYNSNLYSFGVGKLIKVNDFIFFNINGKVEIQQRNQFHSMDIGLFNPIFQKVNSRYLGISTGFRFKLFKGLHIETNGSILKHVNNKIHSSFKDTEEKFRYFNKRNRKAFNIGFGYAYYF